MSEVVHEQSFSMSPSGSLGHRGRTDSAGRSISFSGPSSSSTRKSATATPTETASPAACPRWNAELEERLLWAQKELKQHQKRWSEGQEAYLAEVDRLLEMKRQAKKFVRRRSQDHKREGRSLERVSSTSNKEKGTETPQDVPPDEDISGTETRLGRIIRRSSSGLATPKDEKSVISVAVAAPGHESTVMESSGKGSRRLLRAVLRLHRRSCRTHSQ